MRILLVNKFLHHVGGAETVFFAEWSWLAAAGHEIIPFGMDHPANTDSSYRDYWVPQVDYQRPTLAQMRRLIYSPEAAHRLAALVNETRPDIAHLHNIYHQLSPSILPVLQNAGVPIVMTVHDYKLICPNYRLFTQDAPCTRCVGSHTGHALRYRCHRSSYVASALVALESAVHRRQQAYAPVDLWLAPSRFIKEMLIRGGYPAGKIRVLPHALAAAPTPEPLPKPLPAGKFVLYAGRLEVEKGLDQLWQAAAQLPDIPFVLAGSGSLAGQLPAQTNVTTLGKLTPGQLAAVRRQAAMELLPAIWYEVFGLSILEAQRTGLPVIASAIGALPELVQHEQTGLLVPPGDVPELVQAIRRLWADDTLARRLGQAGREHVRAHYRPEQHLDELLDCYDSVRNRTPDSQAT